MNLNPDDPVTHRRILKTKQKGSGYSTPDWERQMLHDLLDQLADLWTQDLNPGEARTAVLEQIGRILGADSWSVYLLSSDGEITLLEDSLVGEGDSDAPLLRSEIAEWVVPAIQEDRAVLSRDATGNSAACLPLRSKAQVIGAVFFSWNDANQFREISAWILWEASKLAGAVLASTGRLQQLQEEIADLELRQRQLLKSRNTLRALFDNSPTAMYIIDSTYNLLAINRQRANQAGKPPQELVSKRCHQALYARAEPCPACRVFESLTSGAATRRVDQRLNPDGEIQEIEIHTFPIRDDTGSPVEAFLFEEDITERVRLQAQLAQTDKLAIIGQLAAGVAHEINNPLTVIMANAQLLQRRISPQQTELREMADLIIQAGERATQAVRDLLDFARRERFEVGEVDINASLRRVLALIRHEFLANSIGLTFLPDESLPPVIASQDQLEGVWLNLLLNAIDAIHPGPGHIHITTCHIADQVQIVFADNGHGINPEQLPHIFEPFFTTKGPGRGTGLGLSVCQQIIARHGGEIRVWSQPGVGTQFTIILP